VIGKPQTLSRPSPTPLNVSPQVIVSEVQERIRGFKLFVFFLRCHLSLIHYNTHELGVEIVDLFENEWNVDLHESCQSETLIPSHITDSNHILQQLDHFRLDPVGLIQRPLAGALCEALELHVKPESVGLRVPFGIESDAQALIAEGIEHVLECRPVVSVLEQFAPTDTHGPADGALNRPLPIEPARCFRLSSVISSKRSTR
jgi:hypothetical protein